MITFFIAIAALILGYLLYSRIIEKIAGVDPSRQTPVHSLNDGVDYMPMPWWRLFLIQFLNIAGLGPIFGAVAGAMWGPAALLWIVLGSVFAGAVHDFFSGFLSIRHNGLSITEIIGIYLGKGMKYFIRGFTVVLMVLVGAVFIMGPAKILAELTPESLTMNFWVWVVFGYYVIATMLPIDKIIGRIYPFFGFCILFMAVGLITALLVKGYHMPELNGGALHNFHSEPGKFPFFPMLFITIACGAISGFHSTQSPLVARCITSEKYFSIIWRYFAWANQTLGMVVLWTITIYLTQNNKFFWITFIPAVFMTAVTTTYILFAPEGFALTPRLAYSLGAILTAVSAGWFFIYQQQFRKQFITSR